MEAQVGQLYHRDENNDEGEEVEIEGSEESLVHPVNDGVQTVERHALRDSVFSSSILASFLEYQFRNTFLDSELLKGANNQLGNIEDQCEANKSGDDVLGFGLIE